MDSTDQYAPNTDTVTAPDVENSAAPQFENKLRTEKDTQLGLQHFRAIQNPVLSSRKTERMRRAKKNLRIITRDFLNVPMEPIDTGMTTILQHMNKIMKEREQRFVKVIERILDEIVD